MDDVDTSAAAVERLAIGALTRGQRTTAATLRALVAERDRLRDGANDVRIIAEGLVRENERLLRALGLNPHWSQVPAHLLRKYGAALTGARTDG